MFVYCLISNLSHSTYVGATVNLDHRLRQHNKEIKGGAHATGIKCNQGEFWEPLCYVKGFPTWQSALQFEWRWKHISRKYPRMEPAKRRIKALTDLLSLDKSTKNAVPYSEWETPPKIMVKENSNIDFFDDSVKKMIEFF